MTLRASILHSITSEHQPQKVHFDLRQRNRRPHKFKQKSACDMRSDNENAHSILMI